MRLTLRYRFGWTETVLLLHEEEGSPAFGVTSCRVWRLRRAAAPGRSTELIEVMPYLKRA